YRQPVITGPIVTDGKSLVRDYTFARGVAKAQLKAAVPGPLTFATLASRDEHFSSLEDRVLAIADATAREIRGLSDAGARMVDIEDPAGVASPLHLRRAREAHRACRGRAARHRREGARVTVEGGRTPLKPPSGLMTTTVGSFGKPEYLTKARGQHARGKLGATELEDLERKATAEWIRRQEDIGLDVLVDGEMYRGDMVAYFAERLEGFKLGGLVRSYGNRYYHK